MTRIITHLAHAALCLAACGVLWGAFVEIGGM